MRPEYKELIADLENSVEYWSQTAILDFTEELSRLMDEEGVSRAELARRIGASPAYITKVLRGNVNFTLTTMTKLARALERVVRVHLSPEGVLVSWDDKKVSRNVIIDVVVDESANATEEMQLSHQSLSANDQQHNHILALQ